MFLKLTLMTTPSAGDSLYYEGVQDVLTDCAHPCKRDQALCQA